MKKIIFCNIPMRKDLISLKYVFDGTISCKSDVEVIFPINALLSNTMKKTDNVKVVLLVKNDIENNCYNNTQIFKNELNEINKNIGVKIEYVIIDSPFEENKDIHETLFRRMINELEDNCEIAVDITYGPKPLPIIMFSVMNFAEKFFNSSVVDIIYGKVDFIHDKNGGSKPINPIIYDLSPLYYLHSITNSIECKNSADAIKILDTLLSI